MEKNEVKKQASFTYEEEGTNIVSQQIMDAYNCGVIDQENGQFVWDESQKSLE